VRILALDVGEKRIGVATGDDEGGIATPLAVIQRRSTATAVSAVVRVVAEQGAAMVVVGLPISFDGRQHAQAARVRAFAERLARLLAVPLVFQDESLSTVRAAEALRAAGVRPERMRARIDAAAAAVILQEYLDTPRDGGSATRRPAAVLTGDEPA
jgi:putative Holliday junction resolvase